MPRRVVLVALGLWAMIAGCGDDGGGGSGGSSGGSGSGVSCPAPMADCYGYGDCGTDLSRATENCGTCGNDCGLAGCVNGACLPQPVTLASGLDNPRGLAIDGTHAYVTVNPKSGGGSGALLKIPLAGGPTTTLFPDQPAPGAVALDGGMVYWEADSDLFRAPVTGGAPALIAEAGYLVRGIVFDATNAYWAYFDGIAMAPKAGGQVTQLAPASPRGIVMDNTALYYTSWGGLDEGFVAKLPLGGGEPVMLATMQRFPGPLALHKGSVYWVETGGSGLGLLRVPVEGGTPEVVYSGTPGGFEIFEDTFYLHNGKRVGRMSLDGSESFDIGGSPGWVEDIAVDASGVYVLTQGTEEGGFVDGTLVRLER